MTREEFNAAMQLLVQEYGKEKYPPIRLVQIWEEAGTLPAKNFHRVVRRLIGNHERAPMLRHFRELITLERDQIRRDEEWERLRARQDVQWGSDEVARHNLARIRELLGGRTMPLAPPAADLVGSKNMNTARVYANARNSIPGEDDGFEE